MPPLKVKGTRSNRKTGMSILSPQEAGKERRFESERERLSARSSLAKEMHETDASFFRTVWTIIVETDLRASDFVRLNHRFLERGDRKPVM